MQLRQWEYVWAVIRFGTLREAARRLYVTEATISQQIRELEQELGTPLFSREGHRLRLTAEASALLPAVETLLDAAKSLHRLAAAIRERPGYLRLGSAAFAIRLWAPVIGAFRQACPEVTIDMTEASSVQLLEQITRRQLDAALVTWASPPPATPSIRAVRLRQGHLRVVVGSLHSWRRKSGVRVAELMRAPLILFRKGFLLTDTLFTYLGSTLEPARAIETDSGEIALTMVEAGHGVLLAPDFTIETWSSRALHSLPLTDAEWPIDLYFLQHTDRNLPEYAKTLERLVYRILQRPTPKDQNGRCQQEYSSAG